MRYLKRLPFFACIFFSCLMALSTNAQTNTAIRAIYTGSTPYGNGAPCLQAIPAMNNCDFITWRLTLMENATDHTPTTYTLHITYGESQPSTTGFKNGGIKKEITGAWRTGKGTKGSTAATIIILDQGKTAQPISLIQLDDNLLHLLDTERRLMIGSDSFSYTLNRAQQ